MEETKLKANLTKTSFKTVLIVVFVFTFEMLRKAKLYAPEALHVVENDGENTSTKFSLLDGNKISVSPYGVTFPFNTQPDEQTVSLMIDAPTVDPELFAATVQRNMKQIEKQVITANKRLNKEASEVEIVELSTMPEGGE